MRPNSFLSCDCNESSSIPLSRLVPKISTTIATIISSCGMLIARRIRPTPCRAQPIRRSVRAARKRCTTHCRLTPQFSGGMLPRCLGTEVRMAATVVSQLRGLFVKLQQGQLSDTHRALVNEALEVATDANGRISDHDF